MRNVTKLVQRGDQSVPVHGPIMRITVSSSYDTDSRSGASLIQRPDGDIEIICRNRTIAERIYRAACENVIAGPFIERRADTDADS